MFSTVTCGMRLLVRASPLRHYCCNSLHGEVRHAPKIKEIRAFVVEAPQKSQNESSAAGADYHKQSVGHWIVDSPIANPMSIYSRYKASRTSWGIDVLGTVAVEVELEDGSVGIGTSVGGEPACFIIEKHLSRFVEGQDPRNVELMWDQMWRATMNYGRKGLPVHAIAAVDLAVWDALARWRKEPMYMILGGNSKPDGLPVYATTLRPDIAKQLGFKGAKIPLPFGPAEGERGLAENCARVEDVRAAVGPEFPLMLDCYMSLTVPYTIELARRLEKCDIRWIEEIVPNSTAHTLYTPTPTHSLKQTQHTVSLPFLMLP